MVSGLSIFISRILVLASYVYRSHNYDEKYRKFVLVKIFFDEFSVIDAKRQS